MHLNLLVEQERKNRRRELEGLQGEFFVQRNKRFPDRRY